MGSQPESWEPTELGPRPVGSRHWPVCVLLSLTEHNVAGIWVAKKQLELEPAATARGKDRTKTKLQNQTKLKTVNKATTEKL